MLKLLVTGPTGMLGSEIFARLNGKYQFYGCGRHKALSSPAYLYFDLASQSYQELANFCLPDVIINCAALTDHEMCASDPGHAMEINAKVLEKLAKTFPNTYIIQISTDAVFGKDSHFPDENVVPRPESAYGKTKLAGEKLLFDNSDNALALRTTIVGTGGQRIRPSLAEWIICSLQEGKELNLFTDTLFTPINTGDFVDILDWCIQLRPKGALNAAGGSVCSKHAFGLALCHALNLDASLIREAKLADSELGKSRNMDQSLNSSRLASLMGQDLPDLEKCVKGITRKLKCRKLK